MRHFGLYLAFILSLSLLLTGHPGSLQVAAARAPWPDVLGGSENKERGEGLSEKIKSMEPSEQVRYLRELEKSGQSGSKISFYLGNAMYALGKLDSAEFFFNQAIAADSTLSKAYVNLGIVFDAQGKYSIAMKTFERAIEVDPEDVLAHCHLGFLYYSRQQFEKAINNFRRALAIDSKSAQAHYYLGLAFADAHLFNEAIREWETVVELHPEGELGKTAKENVSLIKQYLQIKIP